MHALNFPSFAFILSSIILMLSPGVFPVEIPSADNLTRQASQILQRHNMYRKCHDAPPLQLDPNLNKIAQEEAEALAGNKSRPHLIFQNSYDGFNIFAKPSTAHVSESAIVTPEVNPVDVWYQEIQLYHPGSFNYLADHFTQLIWKSTTKLGVGIAESDNGVIYIVCKYEPVGNVDGQYENNVFPASRKANLKNGLCLPVVFTNPSRNESEKRNMSQTDSYPSSMSLFDNETVQEIDKLNNARVDHENTTSDTATTMKLPDTKDVALYFIIILSVFSILMTTILVLAVMFTLHKIMNYNSDTDGGRSSSVGPSTLRYQERSTRDSRDSKMYPRQESQQESSTNTSSYM